MKSISERVALRIGWKHSLQGWFSPANDWYAKPPDFEHSLDACREIKNWIGDHEMRIRFMGQLRSQIGVDIFEGWTLVCVTASEICAALLAITADSEETS